MTEEENLAYIALSRCFHLLVWRCAQAFGDSDEFVSSPLKFLYRVGQYFTPIKWRKKRKPLE